MHVKHQNLCRWEVATNESAELLLFHKQTNPWGFHHPFSAEIRLPRLTTRCKCVALPFLHSHANNLFCFASCRRRKTKKTHGFRLNRRVMPGGSLRRLPLEVTTNLCVPSVRGGRVSDGPRGICLPFAQPCCLLMMPSAAADIRRVPEFIFPRRRGEERRGAEWWRERFIHWVLEWLIRGNHFIFGSPTF